MPSRTVNQGIINRIPWTTAVVVGLVAFCLVFVLVAGLAEVEFVLQGDGDDANGDTEFEDEPGFLVERGWLLFGAHFVDIDASATTGLGDIDTRLDILDEAVEELPALLFNLIPVLVLISSGFLFVRNNLEFIQSGTEATLFALTISVGYLPIVLFSTLFIDFQTEADGFPITYEIPLVEGALIAGVLFPVAFGAIGGYLAYSQK